MRKGEKSFFFAGGGRNERVSHVKYIQYLCYSDTALGHHAT